MLSTSHASLKLLKNVSKLSLPTSSSLLHTSQVCEKKKCGSNPCCPTKVAVILSGCGALDGTEISEAISVAIHLSCKSLEPNFYAPDINVCGTVNHLTKNPEDCDPPRNALVEAARLARSAIRPLCECTACDNAALIIPGGLGAARTLSDFASKGCDCVVLPDIDRLLKEFTCACKPIGGICIASALIAKALCGVKVTLGKDCPQDQWPHADAIEKVKQMGAKVEMRDVRCVTHCKQYNVFTTPAWMYACASYSDIHDGIGKMVTMMKKCMP